MVDYGLIGARIKEYRNKAQLTQEIVAERADITVVYLSKIENGKVRPTLDTLSAICAAIGCELGDIFLNVEPQSVSYRTEQVVQLFHSCAPNIKPVALEILKQLSTL